MLRHKECMTSCEKVPSGVAVRSEGGESGNVVRVVRVVKVRVV